MTSLQSRDRRRPIGTLRPDDDPWSPGGPRTAQKVYDNRATVPTSEELKAQWKVAEARRWLPVLKTMHKMEMIAALEENWDGQGAPSVNPTAMAKALRLIAAANAMARSHRAPKVDAVIAPDGGLLIEWDSRHRVVQIQVHPDGAMNAIVADDPDSLDSEWHEISDIGFRVAVSLAQSAC